MSGKKDVPAATGRFDKYIDVNPKTAEKLLRTFEIGLARAVLEASPTHAGALMSLGAALTTAGRHEEALRIDLRATEVLGKEPIAFYNLACSYSNLGRVDEALAALEKTIALGYRDYAYMLKDPDLKKARRDPRFRQLLNKKWGKRQP